MKPGKPGEAKEVKTFDRVDWKEVQYLKDRDGRHDMVTLGNKTVIYS